MNSSKRDLQGLVEMKPIDVTYELKKRGYTLTDVSRELGVHHSVISNVVNHAPEVLNRISTILSQPA